MEDDRAWRDRCDRYFSSLSENNSEPKQNGHLKNRDKTKTENRNLWKNLAAMRKRSNENPVTEYIRNTVFKIDIHGSKMAGKSSHNIELLIWGIIMAALFGFTIFLVVLQYGDYSDDKAAYQTVSINKKDFRPTPMAFTICNMNIVKKSRTNSTDLEYLINDTLDVLSNSSSYSSQTIQSILMANTKLNGYVQASKNDSDIIRLLEQDVVVREMLRSSNETVVARLRASGSTGWFHDIVGLNNSDVSSFGHQSDDVIVKCFVGTRECNESKIQMIPDTKHGNCLTFSPEVTSDPVQLILNAEADEYIPGTTPSVGFRIFIHASENNFKEGTELTVGINSLTKLRTVQETLTRRQMEDKACLEKPMTKQVCLSSCYESHVREKCGCSMTPNILLPLCRHDVPDILICRKAIKLLMSSGQILCSCKENCRENSFDVIQSVLPWPPENYMPIVSSILIGKNISFTESQIRNNLAAVSIDLKPETSVVIEETKELTILDLLSRVGGLLAFVAGMSMLTLVEILWTVMKWLSDICVYFNRKSRGVKEAERLSDSNITSVTWAMQKQQRRQEELDKEFQMNNGRADKRKGQGLTGNVNNRLQKRNAYLSPINENHNDSPEGHSDRHAIQNVPPPQQVSKEYRPHGVPGNGYHKQTTGSHPYETKGNKYRVPQEDADMDRYYINKNNINHAHTNGQLPKPHNGVAVLPYTGLSMNSGPYDNNIGYQNTNIGPNVLYRDRPPLPSRGQFPKQNDPVHLYKNASAYFDTNVSDPVLI